VVITKQSPPWINGQKLEYYQYICSQCGEAKSAGDEARVRLMAEKHEQEHKKITEITPELANEELHAMRAEKRDYLDDPPVED
jgi:hypothetical protein